MSEKIWFVYVGDHHEGPFTIPEIGQKIRAGQVATDAFAWKEGMADWKAMAEMPEFRSVLTPPPAATGPTAPTLTPVGPATLSSPAVTLGAKGAQPTGTTNPSLTSLAGIPASSLEAPSQKSRFRVSKTLLVIIVLGALSFALLKGWLDPVLQSPAVKGVTDSVKFQLVDRFPSLGSFVSLLPPLEDVDPADYEVLTAAAHAPRDQGVKVAVAVSKTDLIAPQFYVASNLPDGTVIEIRINGISETLLNATDFMATTQATLSKRLGKSSVVRAPDGKPIPRGNYMVYAYESANQPAEIQNGVLAGLPATTVRLPADIPKGRKVAVTSTQFLGGPRDATYSQRLTAYHEQLKSKAKTELDEAKQYAATFESQLTQTLSEFAAAKAVKQKPQRVARWTAFHEKWSAMNQQIVSKLQALTPEVLRNDYFYGILFELSQTGAAAVTKLHELQNQYFTTAIDPKAFDVQHAEAETLAKSSIQALRAKIDAAEKIPASVSGLPSREGLGP